jgi:hypothetical protein
MCYANARVKSSTYAHPPTNGGIVVGTWYRSD